jgi:hypothetical protein
VVVIDVLMGGLQLPMMPLKDVSGKEKIVPSHKVSGNLLNLGSMSESTIITTDLLLEH